MVHGAQQYAHSNTKTIGWASMGDAGTELKFWLQGLKRGFGSLPIGLAGIGEGGGRWEIREVDDLYRYYLFITLTLFDFTLVTLTKGLTSQRGRLRSLP